MYHQKYNRTPSENQLVSEFPTIRGLKYSIHKYGGIVQLRSTCGFNEVKRSIVKEWDVFYGDYYRVFGHLKYIPALNVMKTKNKQLYSDFQSYKTKFGFELFYKKLGKNPAKPLPHKWDEQKITVELMRIINRYNMFPSGAFLRNLHLFSLEKAIYRHGGLNYFREKLNASPVLLALDGHYCQSIYEVIFDNFLYKNGISHSTHEKPFRNKFLCDFKIKDVYIEIVGYDEKHAEYHNRLRKKIKCYEENKLTFLIFSYLDILSPNFEENTIKKLESVGIFTRTLTELKKIEINIPLILSWKDIDLFKAEIIRLSKYENGFFPTDKTIREFGKGAISEAIYSLHGGLINSAKVCGLPLKNKPKNYWTKETVLSEYKDLCRKHGKILLSTEVRKSYSSLSTQLSKYGGISYFRNTLEYVPLEHFSR